MTARLDELNWSDYLGLRQLIMRYAQYIDRRDGARLASLFAENATLESERFRCTTAAEIKAVPEALSVYAKTYHTIFNYIFDVDGDHAEGEVYSSAHHFTAEPDGTLSDFVMTITYRDRYIRQNATWLFAHRHLVVECVETRTVEPLVMTPRLENVAAALRGGTVPPR